MSCNTVNGGFSQGYYNLDIAISDTNPDEFMVGFLSLFKSKDGGVTYTQWGGYGCTGCGNEYRHPDHQEIVINNNDVWVCTDGGVDLYNGNFDFVESRNNGLNASAYWGFDQGWNYDVLVGGRYHNGNAAYYEEYPQGSFLALGGGESATGYVNQGENRNVYHSDIGAKKIPEVITGSLVSISNLSKFSNEDYVYANRSEITNDPRYWNTLYLGKDNQLWKSVDGGITFNSIKTFGDTSSDIVKAIEVSRNDPKILYITQKVGSTGKLWKSTDEGVTWIDVSIPANHQTMYISLNTANQLFLALNNGGYSTNKVFRSNDSGNTWVNLSTSALDNESIENIQVQEGTDGGVYLTSNNVVWYRNNTHNDWQLFSQGLPIHYSITRILPFYKKGRIRIAGSRGIWERDFYEPSLPISQPFIADKVVNCYADTVQFDDYSILNHTGASWEWSFPGASYVSSSTIRNPQVLYSTYGNFDVTLKVTDAFGNTNTKTITKLVEVGNNCSMSELDTDNDGVTDYEENTQCSNIITQKNFIAGGSSDIITDFGGEISGEFYTTVKISTNCYNQTATLKAKVNLNTNTIHVISYTHFGNTSTTDAISGSGTIELISESSSYAKIGFRLENNSGIKQLVFNHISNPCGGGGVARIEQSCWDTLDYDKDGIPNYLDTDSDNDSITDYEENIQCINTIPQKNNISGGSTDVITDFNGAITGIYFTTVNIFANCYSTTATLKARINLNTNTINVISYSHFDSTSLTDPISGFGTNELISRSSSYAKIGFKLISKLLIFNLISNACGSTARINQSCWSNLDGDANGYIDYLDSPLEIITQATNMSTECNPSTNQTELQQWLDNNGGAVSNAGCSSASWSNNYTSLSDSCGETGNTTVTFTATDICGHEKETTATFSVIDTTLPSWSNSPTDKVITCDGITDPQVVFTDC